MVWFSTDTYGYSERYNSHNCFSHQIVMEDNGYYYIFKSFNRHLELTTLYGGSAGIRTQEALTPTSFQDSDNQPLWHTSIKRGLLCVLIYRFPLSHISDYCTGKPEIPPVVVDPQSMITVLRVFLFRGVKIMIKNLPNKFYGGTNYFLVLLFLNLSLI